MKETIDCSAEENFLGKMEPSYGVLLDNIITHLGQFGKFNLYVFVLAFLPVFFTGMYGTNYVFLAADVEYRCKIPECEYDNMTYSTPWMSYSSPQSLKSRRCSRYPLREDPGWPCTSDSFVITSVLKCDEWVYKSNETIVSEFNLACSDWKRTLVGTIHNIGYLVSMPIVGFLSDRCGRKMALVISSALVSAFGTIKGFSVSYEMYITMEFLETVAGASVYPSAFIMLIELLGQKKRVIVSFILGIALATGAASLALLDSFVGYWRTWAKIAYPPSILFLLYIFILPESIRWLMVKGKVEKAVSIIRTASKVNNVEITDDTITTLVKSREYLEDTGQRFDNNVSMWRELVRSPIVMKRLIICATWWMTSLFVYYGLAVHSAVLPGDKHLNYVLISFVEIIAISINTLTLDRLGRKPVLLTAFLSCGVACISLTFVPKYISWLQITLFLVGKVAITMALNGLYMYTSELFPTKARHRLLSLCSMTGRIGSILAPQMPLLSIYMESLPSLLFGIFPIISGILMIFMPETLKTVLPDTFADAERITRIR